MYLGLYTERLCVWAKEKWAFDCVMKCVFVWLFLVSREKERKKRVWGFSSIFDGVLGFIS
jgi:hypothetical protein